MYQWRINGNININVLIKQWRYYENDNGVIISEENNIKANNGKEEVILIINDNGVNIIDNDY